MGSDEIKVCENESVARVGRRDGSVRAAIECVQAEEEKNVVAKREFVE